MRPLPIASSSSVIKCIEMDTFVPPPPGRILGEKLWTVEELALACGVSSKTLRRRQAKGLLPPRVRIGRGGYRYYEADVRSWLVTLAAARESTK